MAAITKCNLIDEISDSLGLPPNTNWFELRMAHNEVVTIKCGYTPAIKSSDLKEIISTFQISNKLPLNISYKPPALHFVPFGQGPGSLTCDNISAVNEVDCKTCLGTGTCAHGKTPEEYASLKDKHGHM